MIKKELIGKTALTFFLVLLLIADVGFSFLQHYSMPFDGDMAGGIVPADDVMPVLAHPFGFRAILEQSTYPNPNRFFSHKIFYEYFNVIPIFLQHFTNPLNSAYLSCALAKTGIQVALIFLVSLVVSRGRINRDFLLSAVLVAPLFQTNGYRSYMGIIDSSTTYAFFYALPTVFVLIYFMPVFLNVLYNHKLSNRIISKIFFIFLAIVSSLSGPLNPGISLVISFLVVLGFLMKSYKSFNPTNFISWIKFFHISVPKGVWFHLMPICVLSVYSLALGTYNSIGVEQAISLANRYEKLPEGIFFSFFQKLGFPILFFFLFVNTRLVSLTLRTEDGLRIMQAIKWFFLFAFMYICVLPLGGYRDYRPLVLRYDTIIPVTLGLMFLFSITTIYVIKNMSRRMAYWYLPFVTAVIFLFSNADRGKFNQNLCEHTALMRIANSQERIVRIDKNCSVLSWGAIYCPEESRLQSQLLRKWRVIEEDKLYHHVREDGEVGCGE
jgi:hypothetical protein